MILAYCNPKDGKLNMEQPTVLKDAVKGLRPRRHVMEIKEYKERRTPGANAYYWTIVIPFFCVEWGLNAKIKEDKEYMHYDILGSELRQIPDELRPGKTKTEQTHTMDGSNFWKYIYRCGTLYERNFNGSFPPPKKLGYDTEKK